MESLQFKLPIGMELTTVGAIATFCFASALIQSLRSGKILRLSAALAKRRPFLSRFLHFAGEPEIVFGMWAAVFLAAIMFYWGFGAGLAWMDSLNFSEVAFVFVIMILASTKPVTEFAEFCIGSVSRILPLPIGMRRYVGILVMGPLLGSLITEPAAMTISALLLKQAVFEPLRSRISDKFFYTTLAVLFVNISVGGSLTHFAAPPVLMVARVWDWDAGFMFGHFGWKAIVAVIINTCFAAWINRRVLLNFSQSETNESKTMKRRTPIWITAVHLLFVTLCVLGVHHPSFVLGLFILFLGFYAITKEEQSEVKIEESMLVGFFLGGLVILTAQQGWWLKPILSSIEDFPLFIGTLLLSPVTDNAAVTSLASQVVGLSETSKYLVVAAALTGGGLTIIANAPNPAGFTLLRKFCPGRALRPGQLFMAALLPTITAAAIFWFL